jgi:3-oxoacyl-[acyl-carrier protein] reductase
VVGVNLKGAFLCCKEVTPVMRKQRKGNIINISSVSGLSQHSAVRYPDYVASKAGLIGLTRSLAVNLGPSIRVNAIAPGVIETDMTTSMSRSRRKAMKEEALLKRLRGPEEIAKAALFLASDESDFVTGEVITVSGGRGMR